MNRILKLSAFTIAIMAITSVAFVNEAAAQYGPYYNLNRGYFNNGYGNNGYGPVYNNGYTVYGNGPYGYGARNNYPNYAPQTYRAYGAGPYGYGSNGGYAGRYSDGSFQQYQGTAYSPYGTSVYVGPFGVGLQGFRY